MVAKGLTGDDGAVRIATVLIGKMRTWTLTRERTMVDTAGFGDDYEEPRGVRKRGTGSAEGIFATGDAGQDALEAAFESGDEVVLDLQQKTGYVTSIHAVISNYVQGTSYDGASSFTFQFSQIGAPIAEAGHAVEAA